MNVGDFVKRNNVSFRTGEDRRLIEKSAQQKVVAFVIISPEEKSKLRTRKNRMTVPTSFYSVSFMFFDTNGRPRGFVNGWQDLEVARVLVEKLQIKREIDEEQLRRMKLMMYL